LEFDHILCHYSEIGLKGKNRKYFENQLRNNILDSILPLYPGSIKAVKRYYGRLVVELTESSYNVIEIIDDLKEVPGLAYCAPAFESSQEINHLKMDAYKLLSSLNFQNFRITARCGSAKSNLTVRKINEEVGAHIKNSLSKKVQLKMSEVNCWIDLFDNKAFLYHKRVPGRGGLPVGVSGKVVAMISGGIDSPVGAYFAMKRGARVIFVHFHSVPYTTPASIEKVKEVVTSLNKFQIKSRLYLVELAPIQKQIMDNTLARFRVLLYRRFMLRISEQIAIKENAKGIVTGESLGQVASQTLENMEAVGNISDISILRPLIGFDKQEIIDKAKDISTYDISIQPDQDCCSLFTPKNPATKAKSEQLDLEEKKLNVDFLVKKALDSAITEII
tara:strand:- start:561 stop:1730 length:1170 start_codon:yes stop_codon:yes gene_type:complete